MLSKLFASIRSLFSYIRTLCARQPVRLAIVRRYQDANGNYVGELYIEQTIKGVTAYNMIGASLDSLPLDWTVEPRTWCGWTLDTRHDFLAPIALYTVRVGAMDPKDNDRIRRMVGKMPRWNMTLLVHNRFIGELKPC